MTDLKKKILIGYSVAMGIASLFVPWKVDYHLERYSTGVPMGYAFLFNNPNSAWTIDFGRIFLEYVALTALAGVLYLISDKFSSH